MGSFILLVEKVAGNKLPPYRTAVDYSIHSQRCVTRDTKSRTNIKNQVRQNLDIVLQFKNQQVFANYVFKWRRRYTMKM